MRRRGRRQQCTGPNVSAVEAAAVPRCAGCAADSWILTPRPRSTTEGRHTRGGWADWQRSSAQVRTEDAPTLSSLDWCHLPVRKLIFLLIYCRLWKVFGLRLRLALKSSDNKTMNFIITFALKMRKVMFWSPCIYLFIYVFICMRVTRITKKVLNRITWNLVGWLVIIRGPFD